MRTILALIFTALAVPALAQTAPFGLEVVAEGFDAPVYAVSPPGDTRLFVVEQSGTIRILAGGEVRAAGTREQIRSAHARPEWVLETDDAGFVRGIRGIEVIEFDGGHVRFTAPTDDDADRVLREAIERGTVRSFAPSIRPLTEIFQEVIR